MSWTCAHIAKAEPVWHCSRTHVQVADASDAFSLAGLGLDREYIQISLRDLYGVYQGEVVRMSGHRLSACVIRGGQTTADAMASIGLSSHAPIAITRQSNLLAPSTIYVVNNEQEMVNCIANHHPAIGYLNRSTHTDAIGPCF